MFTLNQINEAHSKIQSGAGFPGYIQDLTKLGVLAYTVYVSDGHSEYKGENNYSIASGTIYPMLQVADTIDITRFKADLSRHQQGATNYFTFCENSAHAGVAKWIVDVIAKTCTYYGKSGEFILKEDIPA